MKQGIFDGVKNSVYHESDGRYSSSLIKKMDVPARAKDYMDGEHEHRDCYRIGTAIHAFILEPSVFNTEFLTGIEVPRRSKSDKLEWAAWFSDHGADGHSIIELPAAQWFGEFNAQTGKHIVSTDEIKKIRLMAESVASNKNAMALLEGGNAEQSIYWRDEETGLELKSRPDYMNRLAISDLKSCLSVSDREVTRAISNFGYTISSAMYVDGVYNVTGEWMNFVFIFIEKDSPFLCRCIAVDEYANDRSWEKYKSLKMRLKQCLDSNEWPGIDDELEFSLPEWAI